ncbi:MAG TPA: CsbD family protein [Verrucomicrobiae bacterium]
MSTLIFKGNWNIAKGKLKQKFAQLTDDDLQFVRGKEDELIGRIQKRTSQNDKEITQTFGECCNCKHS